MRLRIPSQVVFHARGLAGVKPSKGFKIFITMYVLSRVQILQQSFMETSVVMSILKVTPSRHLAWLDGWVETCVSCLWVGVGHISPPRNLFAVTS